MKQTKSLLPVVSEKDIKRYWDMQRTMLQNDVFCAEDLLAPFTEEEKELLLSSSRCDQIEALCHRKKDPIRRLFFAQNEEIVGFVMYCIYASEDGKCFVFDFYVMPHLRCQGAGSAFFALFKAQAMHEGAAYFELNTHCVRAFRFWKRQDFLENGTDDAGVILLCLPPKEQGTFTRVEHPDLSDADILWQVRKLINGWRNKQGESAVTDQEMEQLCKSAAQGTASLLLVRRGYRVVGMRLMQDGMCKAEFVEPVFDCKAVERLLSACSEQ